MRERTFEADAVKRQEVAASLEELVRSREEILFAYLFGSFVDQQGFHDIDVGVYVTEALWPEDPLAYEMGLSSQLERDVRYPIDVKLLNRAPIGFCYEVTRGDVLFSRDEPARLAFVEGTWARYLDYQPVALHILKDLTA